VEHKLEDVLKRIEDEIKKLKENKKKSLFIEGSDLNLILHSKEESIKD
jgi:hypothetical protein